MKSYRTSNWYIKEYKLSDLGCSQKEVIDRCSLISTLSETVGSIPTSNFDIVHQDILTLKQEIIREKGTLTIQSLKYLAVDLDFIHKCGLIHGDIHRRNLIVRDDIVFIIDFEPCLHQKRHSIPVLMSSAFTKSKIDRANGEISKLTDKVGLYKICHTLKSNDEPKLSKSFEYKLLGMDCTEIVDML